MVFVMMQKIRKDTEESENNHKLIDTKNQTFIGILARRGSGKSFLAEALIEKYYEKGFTILELWSAPNLESGFWIIQRPEHKKCYPITIVAPESLIIPNEQIEQFNSKHHTKVPLVKIVKLPTPTAKAYSEQNTKFVEILTDVITECRDKKRIMVFNAMVFPNEIVMFRSLELIMRSLDGISNNHFHKLNPSDCNPPKRTFDEMSDREKNYHKMVFRISEFAELAPNREKGDKSGLSTLVKKSLLKFFRLARHSSISGIIDYQSSSDTLTSLRAQIDLWLIKKWTPRLAGEDFKYLFDIVANQRKKLLEKYNYSGKAKTKVKSNYPLIEKLGKKWFYAVGDNDYMKLWKVPDLKIQHKEPEMRWEKITGIELKHDEAILKATGSPNEKLSQNDERLLFFIMKTIRDANGGHKPSLDVQLKYLSKKQEQGEVSYKSRFVDMPPNTLSQLFRRLSKKYGKEEKEE